MSEATAVTEILAEPKVYFGFGESSIADLIFALSEAQVETLLYRGDVLVTCVDSIWQPKSSAPGIQIALANAGVSSKDVSGGLWMDFPCFLRVVQADELLALYNEVWFFDRTTPFDQSMLGISIFPEEWKENPQFKHNSMFLTLPDLNRWMHENGAVLGLGDGNGLRYLCRHEEGARAIKSVVAATDAN